MADFSKSRLAWTLPWDVDWVTAVSFLGPSRRLAAGNNKGDILVWDLPEIDKPAPSPAVRLEGHTNCISRLRSSADGRWLYSSSYDKTIRVWDMKAAPKGKATIVLNERARYEAGRRKGSKVPAAVEVAVQTMSPARSMEGHKDWVTSFDLSRDGKVIVSGDDAAAVIVWDANTGKEMRRWPLKGWAYAVAFSPNAKRVVVSERRPLVFDSGRQAGVRVWDVGTGKELADLSAAFKGIHLSTAAWTPDGKSVLLGRGGEADGMTGIVHVGDPATGKKVRSLPAPGHQYGITDMAWMPDGKVLATCGRDTTIKLWDVTANKLLATLGKPRGGQFKDWLHALSFSADGKLVAAGDMAGAVQVWALG
jgi:WD40 repeat protein